MKNWSKARGAKGGAMRSEFARVCGNFCSVPLIHPPLASQLRANGIQSLAHTTTAKIPK
jgi:hypothetical protein